MGLETIENFHTLRGISFLKHPKLLILSITDRSKLRLLHWLLLILLICIFSCLGSGEWIIDCQSDLLWPVSLIHLSCWSLWWVFFFLSLLFRSNFLPTALPLFMITLGFQVAAPVWEVEPLPKCISLMCLVSVRCHWAFDVVHRFAWNITMLPKMLCLILYTLFYEDILLFCFISQIIISLRWVAESVYKFINTNWFHVASTLCKVLLALRHRLNVWWFSFIWHDVLWWSKVSIGICFVPSLCFLVYSDNFDT